MSGENQQKSTENPSEDTTAGDAAQDPKNVAELTNYIQSMLQQMQDRWTRNTFMLLWYIYTYGQQKKWTWIFNNPDGNALCP